MATYLLTGAAGFIGSHLTRALLEEGHRVIGLDEFNDYYDPRLKHANIEPFLKHKGFRLVEGDIRHLAAMQALVRQEAPEAVLHLAARAGVRPSIRQPLLYEEVNVRGTLNLLECAREFGVGKFLFASSSSVYGNTKETPFREEQDVNHPASPYAATKKAGELLCANYNHLYGIDVTCLRFFTVYGPAQRPDMAIRKFMQAMLEGREISMFGDGATRRDYTYVDDIIQGTMQAIRHLGGYRIYNLGESQTIALSELVALMEETLGLKARIARMPMQPGDVEITCADVSKARREIGYDPKTPVHEGIKRMAEWMKSSHNGKGAKS